jgi:hypothetical protein
MKLCRVCRRPIHRGATGGDGHNATCAACLAARVLRGRISTKKAPS